MNLKLLVKRGFLCLLSYIILFPSCRNASSFKPSIFKSIEPVYENIKLLPSKDSIHFPLTDEIKNNIKSFNYFTASDSALYISFYDHSSKSVAIYNLKDQKLKKIINLKTVIEPRYLYKPSVFVHNFDSIYVTNFERLFLIDSSGKKNKAINFNNRETVGYFDSPVPVVIRNNEVIMGARVDVDEKVLSDIKDWKVLCVFDFDRQRETSKYPLPPVYHKGLYGKKFMEYSYCYNDKDHFVFSFPADTNIYETDLGDYHMAYYAKSRQQIDPIDTMNSESLDKKKLVAKEYALRDSYGIIYYDPYKKRYLRIARHKISKEAYEDKTGSQTYSIIVFNEDFKIIGEFPYTEGYYLNSVIFTQSDGIYAWAKSSDECTIHFVRLAWSDDDTCSYSQLNSITPR